MQHAGRSMVRRTQAQPQTARRFTVQAGAAAYTVLVTRKRVKNLNLRVRGDGSVVASVPPRVSDARIQEFLDGRAHWIAEHVKRRRAARERAEGASSTVPETVPLWGAAMPTGELFGDAPREGTQKAAGEAPAPDRSTFDRLLADRYRREVERALPAVVASLEGRMGIHAARWQVRSMKTRWGSCTPGTRAIRINARLAAYPPACLEFVVAHELCHLLEPSHNARFHALLDRFCPENRVLAARLRRPALPGSLP